MACSAYEVLHVAQDHFYSEAAHIKPLGKPHDGPDKASNMLVFCPNHHLQFDRGVLRLQKRGDEYEIISKVAGDPLHRSKIILKHGIDADCVSWHHNWFSSERG
ncbi:MAG: HNH endonuclease [Sphingomonadales bacterium]